MRSPVSVPLGATALATDPVKVVQTLAQQETARAEGRNGSEAMGPDDTALHRQAGDGTRSAPATQPRADGVVATELSARTATALGALLADVREMLTRLSQIGDGSPEDERRRLIAAALAKVNRGERLVSGLLAYSGCQPLVPEAVELRPLLCSLANTLRRTLDARIEVTVQVDDDCPSCHVDARGLEDALLNLAVNARDAMSHGGRMHFTARLAAPANGASVVALTLLDTGVGMTMETSQRAALPFFTTKANDPLAGLGLAAVEGFVTQSGGSMALQTWMGTGTVITLYLPPAGQESKRLS
jgi:signal transduction histidine kinase